eukprot:10409022-Prorocentrum_lima.AAC.1
MTLEISTWGEQGRPWWIDVLSPASVKRQEWLGLTPNGQAQLEGRYALAEQLPIPPSASKIESILRVDSFDCIP